MRATKNAGNDAYLTLLEYQQTNKQTQKLKAVVTDLLKSVKICCRKIANSVYSDDSQAAEDSILEGFYKTIFKNLHKYQVTDGLFYNWVKRCVYLHILEKTRSLEYKRRKLFKPTYLGKLLVLENTMIDNSKETAYILDDVSELDDFFKIQNSEDILKTLIDSLAPNRKKFIEMKFYQKCKISEIEATLGVPYQITYNSIKNELRKKYKKIIENDKTNMYKYC